MAIHKDKNFSFGKHLASNVQNGDILIRCMCAQGDMDTPIFEGVTGLTFEECNLENAVPPSDAIIIGGLVNQKFRCSNLHPDLVTRGELTEEPEGEACPHSEVWEVEVDGEDVIDPFYTYDEYKRDEETDEFMFIHYRHIANGKIVDGRA